VPPYKVGIDVLPRGFTNLQALNVEYYSQSLQSHIEEIEELLDDALGIAGSGMGTEFDTDNLLRMDSIAQVTVIKDAVGAGVMSPNEGRAKFDLKPVKGGESPLSQQQYYSLEALAKRDAQAIRSRRQRHQHRRNRQQQISRPTRHRPQSQPFLPKRSRPNSRGHCTLYIARPHDGRRRIERVGAGSCPVRARSYDRCCNNAQHPPG
jgi:hypothetical protein